MPKMTKKRNFDNGKRFEIGEKRDFLLFLPNNIIKNAYMIGYESLTLENSKDLVRTGRVK